MAEISLSGLLHLDQDHGGDLLRGLQISAFHTEYPGS